MHTRLLTRAKEWERETKESSFLLRGKDLREAEQWIAKSAEKEPAPTALHSQYILASRQAANQLQRIIIAAVAAAFVIAMGLAVYAFIQKNLAQRETKEAERQRTVADVNATEAEKQRRTANANAEEATRQKNTAVRNETEATRQEGIAKEETAEAERQARISDSGRLAAIALLSKDDHLDLASLLSLEAVGTADTFEARDALFTGFQSNPRFVSYLHHPSAVNSVTFSPDGKTIAAAGTDHSVQLWDVATRQPLGEPLKGQDKSLHSVTFSPDGKTRTARLSLRKP